MMMSMEKEIIQITKTKEGYILEAKVLSMRSAEGFITQLEVMKNLLLRQYFSDGVDSKISTMTVKK